MFRNVFKSWVLGLVVLLSSTGTSLLAQDTDSAFSLRFQIDVAAKFFTTDKLRQIYVVTETNEVIKYSPDGNELFRFNNNKLGDLSLVDVTNPFNVLLYYPDFQLIITLDRTLSQTAELDLLDLNFANIGTIGTAIDNHIWLYDNLSFQLKKINQTGQNLVESNDLSLLLGAAPDPTQIVARGNWVYVNDPKIGIIVFDQFGQFHKTLPIKDVHRFQILDDDIILQHSDQYSVFNLKSLFTDDLSLPRALSKEEQVRIQHYSMFILTEKSLEVYSFN